MMNLYALIILFTLLFALTGLAYPAAVLLAAGAAICAEPWEGSW